MGDYWKLSNLSKYIKFREVNANKHSIYRNGVK